MKNRQGGQTCCLQEQLSQAGGHVPIRSTRLKKSNLTWNIECQVAFSVDLVIGNMVTL
jgi:hypothetical protein